MNRFSTQFEASLPEFLTHHIEQYYPVSEPINAQLDILFNPEKFASSNGNFVMATTIFGIAAFKALCPEVDVCCLSAPDKLGHEDYPSLRVVAKIAASIARMEFDPSLLSGDAIAGARRWAMLDKRFDDAAYDGAFRDPQLGVLFLNLVQKCEYGGAPDIFQGMCQRYLALTNSRQNMAPITRAVSESVGWNMIQHFLGLGNAGARAEAVTYAIASIADGTVDDKTKFNANETAGQVGDINGQDYAVEAKSMHLRWQDVLATLVKAREANCNRVTVVVARDRAFQNDDDEQHVRSHAARLFPAIALSVVTLKQYLRLIVAGEVGRVTVRKICEKLSVVLQNLMPFDSNAWNDIINDYIIDHDFALQGNKVVYKQTALCF